MAHKTYDYHHICASASFCWWFILVARLLVARGKEKTQEWAMADERESSPRRAGVRAMASSSSPPPSVGGFHVPNYHRYAF